MADYPQAKLAEGKGNPGLSGNVVDSNIEGRNEQKPTVRPEGFNAKKSANRVGSVSVSTA